jgi:hypothetical protein
MTIQSIRSHIDVMECVRRSTSDVSLRCALSGRWDVVDRRDKVFYGAGTTVVVKLNSTLGHRKLYVPLLIRDFVRIDESIHL